MAAKNQEQGAALLVSIEEMQQRRKTPDTLFFGACFAQGWKPGKAVTPEQYDEAVKQFALGPIGKAAKYLA